MKFFKDNSYDIVKLFVNQIGIAIFSMALYTAISIAVPATSDWASKLEVMVSVAATAFYFVLIYIAMWEIGATDAIRIESGKIKATPYKGALMGLMANAPNFLLTGVALIFMSIGVFGAVEWCQSVFAVLNLFFGFLESMYLGAIINIVPIATDASANVANIAYLSRNALYFAAPILSVLTTAIGYIMGLKNKRIFPKTTTKRPE